MKSLSSFLFLLLIVLLAGCNDTSDDIKVSDIQVWKTNKHPFLVDHSKKLVVVLSDSSTNEMPMYSDTGSGCNSHLYEEDDYFVLIECNGRNFLINKENGKITKGDWNWMHELPEKYVCTYSRNRGDEYSRVLMKPSFFEVYKYKDPGD